MNWYTWAIILYLIANAIFIAATYDTEIRRGAFDVVGTLIGTGLLVWFIVDLSTC